MAGKAVMKQPPQGAENKYLIFCSSVELHELYVHINSSLSRVALKNAFIASPSVEIRYQIAFRIARGRQILCSFSIICFTNISTELRLQSTDVRFMQLQLHSGLWRPAEGGAHNWWEMMILRQITWTATSITRFLVAFWRTIARSITYVGFLRTSQVLLRNVRRAKAARKWKNANFVMGWNVDYERLDQKDSVSTSVQGGN